MCEVSFLHYGYNGRIVSDGVKERGMGEKRRETNVGERKGMGKQEKERERESGSEREEEREKMEEGEGKRRKMKDTGRG